MSSTSLFPSYYNFILCGAYFQVIMKLRLKEQTHDHTSDFLSSPDFFKQKETIGNDNVMMHVELISERTTEKISDFQVGIKPMSWISIIEVKRFDFYVEL